MKIEQAQRIVEKEGLAWIVIDVEKVSDITVLIICKWNGEIRYVSYSLTYNGVTKIM